jgi:competence protein ComEA
VNINTATQEELETLPGIGPTKARAIIEYRREKGPFQTPDELQEVSGIGPKTWEGLKDRVRT